MKKIHKPVMLEQILQALKKNDGFGTIIDATLGDGGHSFAIYKQVEPKVLISLDLDNSAIEFVSKFYKDFVHAKYEFNYGTSSLENEIIINGNNNLKTKWDIVHANFAYIYKIVKALNIDSVDAVLWDLGVSSRQLETKERGFSFNSRAILDMRMDKKNNQVPAYTLLNVLSKKELTKLFVTNVHMYKEMALLLAEEIVKERKQKPFGDKQDIKRLVNIAYTIRPLRKGAQGRLHPATLVFLALRMAVNSELRNLQESLESSLPLLSKNGMFLIITFHSVEQELVENFCQKNNLSRSLLLPSKKEIKTNPRARSAKLNVITHG